MREDPETADRLRLDETVELTIRLPRGTLEDAISRHVAPTALAVRRLAFAKWILSSRRQRARCFGGSIRLGEPTWDMVLDLYVASKEEHEVDTMGICLASGVPPTTAQRYVDILVETGMIVKRDDPSDGRRLIVSMSEELQMKLERWIDRSMIDLHVLGWIASADEPLAADP